MATTWSAQHTWGSTSTEVVASWEALGRDLAVADASSRVWELGAGEPVVCLHGVPASAFLYRKVLPELAELGLRGVAFDLPGLGFAERPRALDYSWPGLSAWCARALEALAITRFHLVVHDIGGPIGFDLVRRLPERVMSLTVLNTLCKTASFRKPLVMAPFEVPGLGELYLKGLSEAMFDLLMRQQGVSREVPSAEVRAYVRLLKRDDGGRAFLTIMRSFTTTEAFERGFREALDARRFPVRLLWGEGDTALRVESKGAEAKEVLGVDELVRLPGKHFVQEDAPRPIAEAVAAMAQAT